MGCFSCLGGKSARRVRLMFVGLDGAGKSTLLQTIAGDPEEPTVPTVGFHNVALRRERTFDSGFDVDVFDLGGGKRIRGIWKHYVADVHACVFVVDSADSKRAEEAREALLETIRDPQLSGKPVAVFANKQDLPGARSEAEVAKALGLDTVGNARYRVIACTSLLGREGDGKKPKSRDAGVDDGMRWLLSRVGEDWAELAPRVARESEQARAARRTGRLCGRALARSTPRTRAPPDVVLGAENEAELARSGAPKTGRRRGPATPLVRGGGDTPGATTRSGARPSGPVGIRAAGTGGRTRSRPGSLVARSGRRLHRTRRSRTRRASGPAGESFADPGYDGLSGARRSGAAPSPAVLGLAPRAAG